MDYWTELPKSTVAKMFRISVIVACRADGMEELAISI